MKFRTEIIIPDAPFSITHHNRILTLGSCFAKHISSYLQRFRFPLLHNPFGVLYNPVSILESLNLLQSEHHLARKDLLFHNDEWHSFYFHGSYSGPDPETTLGAMNASLETARSFLKTADRAVITFGTSYVYIYRKTNRIVSNCHKIPATAFEHRILTPYEVEQNIQEMIRILRSCNPDIRLIFTVSPVRHWKDGAVENQVSKATLHLAINSITRKNDGVFYFPSYEILMDDLRDYRYYEKDLIHPNRQAVEYVWEKFSETFIPSSEHDLMDSLGQLIQAREHRPHNPHSPLHQKFVKNQLKLISNLKERYPHIDLLKDEEYFKGMLGGKAE